MWNVFIVDDQTIKRRVDICLIDKIENLDIARKILKEDYGFEFAEIPEYDEEDIKVYPYLTEDKRVAMYTELI